MTRRVVEGRSATRTSRCLSHPTGRLIGRRPENARRPRARLRGRARARRGGRGQRAPDRLDLRGEHVRDAIAAGVKIVCSTDAHGPERLAYMELAVRTARRGGATAGDVLNTAGPALALADDADPALRRHDPLPGRPARGPAGDHRPAAGRRRATAAPRSSPARSSPPGSPRRCRTPSCCCSTSSASTRCSREGMPRDEAELEVALRAVRRWGIEAAIVPGDLPVALADRLRDGGIGIEVDAKAVEARRRAKTPAELEGIRRAQRAAERGHGRRRGADPRRERADGLLQHDGRPLTAETVRAAIRAECAAAGAPAPPGIMVVSPVLGRRPRSRAPARCPPACRSRSTSGRATRRAAAGPT